MLRDDAERQVKVELGQAPSPEDRRGDAVPDRDDDVAFGAVVAPLTPQMAARLGLPATMHGLVVEGVNPDSRAADAGLRPGDVIEQANWHSVGTVADLRKELSSSSIRLVLLLVTRDGVGSIFLTARAS